MKGRVAQSGLRHQIVDLSIAGSNPATTAMEDSSSGRTSDFLSLNGSSILPSSTNFFDRVWAV